MNEIEQAIETIRKISDIETNKNYDELHRIKTFNYDLLTAAQALQEKAEREKGCDYCRGGKVTDSADLDKKAQIRYWIHKNKLIVTTEIDGVVFENYKKINCCFNCGKRLE